MAEVYQLHRLEALRAIPDARRAREGENVVLKIIQPVVATSRSATSDPGSALAEPSAPAIEGAISRILADPKPVTPALFVEPTPATEAARLPANDGVRGTAPARGYVALRESLSDSYQLPEAKPKRRLLGFRFLFR